MDYYNLQTFSTKALLSRCQAWWAQELAQYDFKSVFTPGAQNGQADVLTWWSRDLPEEGDGRPRPTQPLIPTEKFSNLQLSLLSVKHDHELCKALITNTIVQESF